MLHAGYAVNGQSVLEVVEERSSPSRINATKGSSIWLHWNYTYIGDGTHNGTTTVFSNQLFAAQGLSSGTSNLIATKLGQGPLTLVPAVPAPFTGRLGTISTNSTIVVHNVQYTDSNYRFASRAYVHVFGTGSVVFHLKPVVHVTVYGKRAPFFYRCYYIIFVLVI